jgi:hypothetical protein
MTDEREALYRIALEIRAVWLLDRSPNDAVAAIDMILVDAINDRPQIELADAERLGRLTGRGLPH